ncbi:MAG: hypothetical protein HQK92_01825 [Nitrospirae bacterium]|nr:hypothetical protein [Nitrospirota bacterium]
MMKKRFIYFLALLLVITAVAANESSKSVMAMDNVSYIMPFLHTSSNNVVYCIASNMSSDNATVNVTVMSNQTGYTLAWSPVSVSGTLYARNTMMLTFSGTNVTSSTGGSGDISSFVTADAQAYGAIINFSGSNVQTSTSGVWYLAPTCDTQITMGKACGSGSPDSNSDKGGTVQRGVTALPRYTFGRSNRLVGTTLYDVYNGRTTVPLTCQTLQMACFQGTTSPKRNLVGYMCMDTINSMYPPRGL